MSGRCGSLAADDPSETRVQTITDPEGRLVELPALVWRSKILRDHPELIGWHAEVRATVQAPDHIEPDPLPQRRRFYRRGLGPSRWPLVDVTSAGPRPHRHRDRQPQGPGAMDAVNIQIGHRAFDHADYDADSDVLYLHVGEPRQAEGEETPEGHLLRFAPGSQEVVGLTLVGVRTLLKRDGRLIVTVPETIEASSAAPAGALGPV